MQTDPAVAGMGPISFAHDELARQHRALRLEVGELRAMIDSRRATQRTDGYRRMIGVLVARLRERLAVHFDLEQEGAPFAALGAGDRQRFTGAHAALLAEGGCLAELLRGTAPPPAAVGRTLRWLDDVRRHDGEEDAALQA